MKKPKRTPRAQAQPAPAVETPLNLPEVWTVTTCMKERTPKGSTASPVKTSVNELRFGAQVVMTLEGPTGYDSLRDLARSYNAKDVDLKAHHRAYADLPTGTRATLSAKLPESFQGFEDPSTPPPANH